MFQEYRDVRFPCRIPRCFRNIVMMMRGRRLHARYLATGRAYEQIHTHEHTYTHTPTHTHTNTCTQTHTHKHTHTHTHTHTHAHTHTHTHTPTHTHTHTCTHTHKHTCALSLIHPHTCAHTNRSILARFPHRFSQCFKCWRATSGRRLRARCLAASMVSIHAYK